MVAEASWMDLYSSGSEEVEKKDEVKADVPGVKGVAEGTGLTDDEDSSEDEMLSKLRRQYKVEVADKAATAELFGVDDDGVGDATGATAERIRAYRLAQGKNQPSTKTKVQGGSVKSDKFDKLTLTSMADAKEICSMITSKLDSKNLKPCCLSSIITQLISSFAKHLTDEQANAIFNKLTQERKTAKAERRFVQQTKKKPNSSNFDALLEDELGGDSQEEEDEEDMW